MAQQMIDVGQKYIQWILGQYLLMGVFVTSTMAIYVDTNGFSDSVLCVWCRILNVLQQYDAVYAYSYCVSM